MIKTISIVTFISGNETLNRNIIDLYKLIKKDLDQCELIIYTDHSVVNKRDLVDEGVKEFISPSITKYQRILSSLKTSKNDYILFIDNDIFPDYIELKKMILESSDNIDLLFGKITVSQTQTVTEHLVKIDKILSHNIIRPALWNMNVGISVPGQVFLIKRKSFIDILKRYDTLFDDLAIGICAKEHGLYVRRTKSILGKEKPSIDLKTLIRQRVRWAKGYSEMIKFNRNSDCYPFIIIHGLTYHGLLAFIDLGILLLFKKAPAVSIALLCFMLWKLSDNEIREYPYVILYMLCFPVIHSIWTGALLKNLI